MREKLAAKLTEVAESPDPEQLGKPLGEELQGAYRLSFGRYRIVYEVTRRTDARGHVVFEVHVYVLLVGIRRAGDKGDIYAIAKRLRQRGKI